MRLFSGFLGIVLFDIVSSSQTFKMAQASVSASIQAPSVDVMVDLGNPLLNRVVDGFIKVGGIGALHAAAQDSYRLTLQEETSQRSLEKTARRLGKEALQWGLAAGVYTGVTYSMQEARGISDWRNPLVGGAITGAALSLTETDPRLDRVVQSAVTGSAIASAAEFLRNLTS